MTQSRVHSAATRATPRPRRTRIRAPARGLVFPLDATAIDAFSIPEVVTILGMDSAEQPAFQAPAPASARVVADDGAISVAIDPEERRLLDWYGLTLPRIRDDLCEFGPPDYAPRRDGPHVEQGRLFVGRLAVTIRQLARGGARAWRRGDSSSIEVIADPVAFAALVERLRGRAREVGWVL
jgi:hypothetical protein